MAKGQSRGDRPTMGTSAADHVTAMKPIKGRSVKKTAQSKGGMLDAATANHRANIQETLGCSLHPTATLYEQNAAEASQTLRRTVLVPSKSGYQDFRDARNRAV